MTNDEALISEAIASKEWKVEVAVALPGPAVSDDVPHSRIFGGTWAPAGRAWPTHEGHPLLHLLTLRRDELPAALQSGCPAALLSLFCRRRMGPCREELLLAPVGGGEPNVLLGAEGAPFSIRRPLGHPSAAVVAVAVGGRDPNTAKVVLVGADGAQRNVVAGVVAPAAWLPAGF